MCLKKLNPIEDCPASGVGWKEVTRTEVPGEYRPSWPKFLPAPGAKGYCGVGRTNCAKGTIKCKVIYKIGRKYTVKHSRMAYTNFGVFKNDQPYLAGVHLYKEQKPGLIPFKYWGLIAHDDEVIVAKTVMPI